MIREAGPDDRAEVEVRLAARIDGAMFPLANLRAFGIAKGGFASEDRRASRFWLAGRAGVIALTRAGIVLPLLDPETDLDALGARFADHPLTGVVGPAGSARPVLAALGLAGHPMRLDADEPGFALDLAELRLPRLPGAELRPLDHADRGLLATWRAAAKVETEGMTPVEAQDGAERDISVWIAEDNHRLLWWDGRPVAMTGFNACLPEIVQVGGVYTPPALRNRGYARSAVALHLAEARARGCVRAVLFAASPAASRAYLAIGFRPAAPFTLTLFAAPARVTP
jgi:RimJ/RimL family protein N-acetyltransferase